MFSLSCSFCTHRNPEGSKFCNECGSPLNLAPCPRCEAINNLSDEQCAQCGASLSSAAATDAPVHAGPLTQASPTADCAWMEHGSIPTALASRIVAADPHTSSDKVLDTVGEPASTLAAPATVEPRDQADEITRPSTGHRAPSGAHKRSRAYGIAFCVIFVAVAAAVYWGAVETLPPRFAGTTTVEAPKRAREATVPPATPSQTPGTQAQSRESPIADTAQTTQPTSTAAHLPTPSSATSSDAPATSSEPESPPPDAPVSAAASAPRSVEPPVAVQAQESKPSDRPSAKAKARAVGETRARRPAQSSNRDQAERDAIATQRLIARELANFPRTESGQASAPGR